MRGMTFLSRDKFLQGAFILTIAGIIVKFIGAPQRIILARLLGGEGIGLYQMAYPIYLLALSISSAGIPVAISIIVAERIALGDYRGANRVFRISLLVLAVTGLLFTFLLYIGSGWLIEARFVQDPRAYWAIVALAPAIFFVTVLSSYRGYFQGLQMMTPTAISQIVEQLFRVVTMILLAYLLLPHGLEFAAAGASFGACPGAVAGLLVLICFYWRQRIVRRQNINAQTELRQDSSWAIISRIVRLALPVSLANIMLPVVSNIDLLVVPTRLITAGYTVEQATELYGYLTGMAVPLINMATILTASLAVSLVPAVSEAFALRNRQQIYHRTATAMRIANLITIPAMVGMCLLARPISQMLFGTPNADTSIAILAFGIFLLGVHQVTTGVLQGLGYTAIPVINMVISALVKVVMSWILTAMPEFGIKGAAWATNADFGVAALLNIYFVRKYVGFTMDLKYTTRTIIAAALMGVAVLWGYDAVMTHTLHNTMSTLIAILLGGGVYCVALLLLGGVSARDIESIPRIGLTLAKFMHALRLIRR